MRALKNQIRPEWFLNRMDEFVIFNSLGEKKLKNIVKLEIKKVEARLQLAGSRYPYGQWTIQIPPW
jgi:ATP-dependent Clp protease ATP-binding subunit ClpA